MNTENLAPLYLDNQPLTLRDAKPRVSAILTAAGKGDATNVKWLQSRSDTQGKALRGEEIVDRTTEPTKAIYLTCTPGKEGAGAAKGVTKDPAGASASGPEFRSAAWQSFGPKATPAKGADSGDEHDAAAGQKDVAGAAFGKDKRPHGAKPMADADADADDADEPAGDNDEPVVGDDKARGGQKSRSSE